MKNEIRIVIAKTKSIWKPSSEKTRATGPSEIAQMLNMNPIFPRFVAVKIKAAVFLLRSGRAFFSSFLRFLFRKGAMVIGIAAMYVQMNILKKLSWFVR